MDKKLKRSHNFTACEVALLIALVKERASQIECRKSDTDTNKVKNEAWVHVCRKFNAQSKQSIYRDVDVLKNKYNNEKKRAKKKYAEEKRYLYGTGGGPPEDIGESIIDKDIAEIIGTQMTGLPSECDDDLLDDTNTAGSSKNFNNKENIEYITVEAEELDVDDDEEEEKDCKYSKNEIRGDKDERWIKCTPAMLKKPLSSPLKVSQIPNSPKQNLRSNLGRWAGSKQALAALQIDCFKKEHEKKMEHMQEKHDEFIRLQRLEFEARIRMISNGNLPDDVQNNINCQKP